MSVETDDHHIDLPRSGLVEALRPARRLTAWLGFDPNSSRIPTFSIITKLAAASSLSVAKHRRRAIELQSQTDANRRTQYEWPE
jgi:hypothetical protein